MLGNPNILISKIQKYQIVSITKIGLVTCTKNQSTLKTLNLLIGAAMSDVKEFGALEMLLALNATLSVGSNVATILQIPKFGL